MIGIILAKKSKTAKDGVEVFKSAGTRLKSDAKFILGLVKEHPECLSECEKVLFDRCIVNGKEEEKPVDELLFAAMCCEKNVQAFKYLKNDVAKRYLSAVERDELVKGSFQGKNHEIQLKADEDYIGLLKYIRFGYIKSHSLYVGCAVD